MTCNLMLDAQIQLSLPQGRVLSVSDSIDALLGFKPSDFLSAKLKLSALIHQDDEDIAKQLFSSHTSTSNGVCNLRLRQANGRIRCIKASYSKVFPPNDQDVILKLQLQDAKSLYQTQSQAAFDVNFKAMMDITDDYIFFKDRNHVFTGASQSCVSITGSPMHWSDLLGQTDYDVLPEEYADRYYRLEKQVFAGFEVAHDVQKKLWTSKVILAGWITENIPYAMKKVKLWGYLALPELSPKRSKISKKYSNY